MIVRNINNNNNNNDQNAEVYVEAHIASIFLNKNTDISSKVVAVVV